MERNSDRFWVSNVGKRIFYIFTLTSVNRNRNKAFTLSHIRIQQKKVMIWYLVVQTAFSNMSVRIQTVLSDYL